MFHLRQHTDPKIVLSYMTEMAQAIENIANKDEDYQLVDSAKHIRRYKVNRHIDLYYKDLAGEKLC